MQELDDNPLWYKDAVIYQVHVKTFFDSNADGIGDFPGLIQKLDYLCDLGASAIWLLPFYPSPLKDDGYDIADYFSVNPQYGTLDDFQEFLQKAHERDIRVITELVLNHTSDQNAWFQSSRRAPVGSPWRDYYVWSDTPKRYEEARIIFKDFETSNWSWDPVANSYFWHRFYSHQPDLNFDNPEVHDALLKVIDFWLGMGVDGVRLDAVPYLYEREGTNCENLPETHAFLRKLRAHVDGKFKNRMLLAEANQWPEDAAAYFGKGDECHMSFHFPLMPRMFMALQMEDRFPILDILEQTPQIPETAQWATFLRNHDELTLEMVTDEERDYMYRVYATDPRARINLGIRRRLAPLLASNRRKMEVINTLLLSLPGTPIIYYGDEIGMGDNIYLGDRNGVRTPMQWSPDRNGGFSKANPQQLYLPAVIDPEYHYEALNVENQEKNSSSLLWWMRRVVALRKKYKAFGHGSIEFLNSDNSRVLHFVRRFEEEIILCVINLSRFAQVVELDLSAYEGRIPSEIFSQNKFPVIRQAPYVFTLGPYGHFRLVLKEEKKAVALERQRVIPAFPGAFDWQSFREGEQRALLEESVLPAYVQSSRWFGSKGRVLTAIKVVESIRLPEGASEAQLVFLETQYTDAGSETYLLPLSLATAEAAREIEEKWPNAVIARFANGILHDAIYSEGFRAALLKMIVQGGKLRGHSGEAAGFAGGSLETLAGGKNVSLASQVLKAEQSNSSIIFGDKLFLKLYRKLEDGMNPDSEILRFLSERQKFPSVPPFGGSIEYRRASGEPRVLGLLLGCVANEGDAWTYTLDSVGRYFERVLAEKPDLAAISCPGLLEEGGEASPLLAHLVGGIYPARAEQLGQRTAGMHLALSAETTDWTFSPEPFTTLYQRSAYQSMRASVRRTFQLLQRQISRLPEGARKEALDLLPLEKEILLRQGKILSRKIEASKIRIHGDYHLGQVLNTGKDFIIIDFEGEPQRSLGERKLKRCALQDVAGMLRSFHYAAFTVLAKQGVMRAEDMPLLTPLAGMWARYVGRAFLAAYLEAAGRAAFIPESHEDVATLLEAYLLEKATYEVGYELNNRPDWVVIPIRGIQDLLGVETPPVPV